MLHKCDEAEARIAELEAENREYLDLLAAIGMTHPHLVPNEYLRKATQEGE